MAYEKKVTKEIVEKILSLGVKDMPQNPSAQGFGKEQIRGYFYIPEEKILELLSEVEDGVKEVNDKVDGLESVSPEEYQKKIDEALETESKEVVGAINELNDKVGQGGGSGIRTLETAPTTTTEGYIGEIVQVSDGTAYQCTDITDGGYSWVKLVQETEIANKAGFYDFSKGTELSTVPLYLRQSKGIYTEFATDNSGKKVLAVIFANESQVKEQKENMPLKTTQISLITKTGLISNKHTLTEEEKAKALTWLGAFDNFAPKVVTHNITIKCSEGITDSANEFELRATLTSKRHDVYRSIEELEGIVVENAEAWDLRGYWNEETMQYEPELRGTYENVTIETRIETADFDENRKITYLILRDTSGNVVLEVGSPDMLDDVASFYIASDIVE